jgi:phosphatidylserine decarboxylase
MKKYIIKIFLFLLFIKIIYDFYKARNVPYFIDRKTQKIVYKPIPWNAAIGMCIVYKWNFLGKYNFLVNYLVKKYTLYCNNRNKLFSELNQNAKYEIMKFSKEIGIQTHPWIWKKKPEEYISINDFFSRKYKNNYITIDDLNNEKVIVSPCECKITVFRNIDEMKQLWVKNNRFSLKSIGLEEYKNGSVAIFRLSPYDYHRFHMPIDGEIIDIINNLKPFSHSVKPCVLQATDFNILNDNRFRIIKFKTKYFGIISFMLVGAIAIDTIKINKNIKKGMKLKKGTDLGTFLYGGSTCIIFCKKNIDWNHDLNITINNKIIEVYIIPGEKIGYIF